MSEIFDITKVRFEGYLQGLKVGSKGYVGNTLSDLKANVEKDDYVCTLLAISDTTYPFEICCESYKYGYRYFYLVEEQKEKRYRPYTWEERAEILGKIIKRKDSDCVIMVTVAKTEEGKLFINSVSASYILENYTWIDGSPCGVEIKE